MKRIFSLLLLAVVGFYIVWPAYSGYRLARALETKDAGALESTVDFPAVRDSLRPVATAAINDRFDKEAGALGPLGQTLGGDVKAKMLPQLVEQVLASLVTPETVIRLAHDGGNITAAVEKVVIENMGKMGGLAALGGQSTAADGDSGAPNKGGLGGLLGQVMGAAGAASALGGGQLGENALDALKKPAPVAAPGTASPATKRSFGIGNIKGFNFANPLSFNIAVARDAAQPKADATFGISFVGTSWKLTRVVPNL